MIRSRELGVKRSNLKTIALFDNVDKLRLALIIESD
jgi:hypothetical protein